MSIGINLGVMLRGGGGSLNYKLFNFKTGTLDSDLTYTRADTVATYRDSNGVLQLAASNTPRFTHNTSGNPLGIIMEGSTQNKFTGRNATPTDTTGWAKGGDAASTLACIDDPASYLSGAKLTGVCSNGKVWRLDNSAGATDAWAETSATFGATTVHTISAWMIATGGNAELTRSGTTPTTKTITAGGSFARQEFTLTPNATTDKMRIVAKAGAIVYFILPQIEVNSFASTEIITTGAAATREVESLNVNSVNTKSWFSEAQGTIMARVRFTGYHASGSRYAFALHNAATSNLIGLRLFNDQKMRPNVAAASATKLTASIGYRPRPNIVMPMGLAWKSGESTAYCAGGQYVSATYTGDPSGITTLSIGHRNSTGEPMYGIVEAVRVYKSYEIYNEMIGANDDVIIGGGQSNMVGLWISAADSTDDGAMQMLADMDSIDPKADGVGVNLAGNGATNASYLLDESTATSVWWINGATGALGECYTNFLREARGCNGRVRAIMWDQGEAEESLIYAGTITRAQYKAGLLRLFNQMRTDLGNLPIFISPLGSHDTRSGSVYQDIREVQKELADEYDWIHVTPCRYDLARVDDVHLTNAGYITHATRLTRKVLKTLGESVTGGVDGAYISAASRSGATVTVTIMHDEGATDFTPSSAIQGFKYFVDGSEIAVTAAVRTDATTITLTLASTPVGAVHKLYYAFAECDDITDYTKVVRDNSTQQLPLQFTNGGVTVT